MNNFSCVLLISLIGSVFGAAFIPADWGSRIVGGTEASPGQFPYMASMRSAANIHFCGGWIHSSRWVVSAAHCTVGRTTANTIAVVGAHTRFDGTTHTTAAIVNHPNYSANTINNDISCIQTIDPIVFNDRVVTIPLGTTEVGGNVNGMLQGWGLTSSPGSGSEVLMFLNTLLLNNDDCVSRIGGVGSLIFPTKICSLNDAGQGACNMDSGSPVTVGNSVAGAVSWSTGCANGAPDVHERVTAHLTWLLDTMI